MTSTLQQEAGRKLRFPSARTMRVAQDLYESGFITYMRTDSTTLSDQALTAARRQARRCTASAYVPAQPRRYDKKVKNAQEAHEAIRPAGEQFRTPEQTGLSGDARRLYELVWMRTVASQMADATGQSVQVRLGAIAAPDDGGGHGGRRVRHQRSDHLLSRVPPGLRGGLRRPRCRARRPGDAAADPGRRRRSRCPGPRAGGA